jgi:2-dehydropantoate 2-reductase
MGTIFVGRPRNPDGGVSDDRVRALQAFLSDAAVTCKTPENMEHAIWNKFMLNVGINQWSAVLGAPYGIFHRCEDARELMRSAMREVQAVARARGIDLSDDDREHWFSIVNTLGAEGKTSMLQDVEAGRPTEVEMFAGRMVALGQELGIATPVNEILLHAIRAVEAERLRATIAAQ